jgi:hypothetical protein
MGDEARGAQRDSGQEGDQVIRPDQLKFEVARVVEAARVGGYSAALRQYKDTVTSLGWGTDDALVFGMAIQGGLRDAGVVIKEPNAQQGVR